MVALSKGNDLASAATITPTHDIHHVTGTATITTINVPSPSFCGRVTFILDGNLDFSPTGGNISRLVNGVINVAFSFIYDPGTSKWYPDNLP